MDAAQDVEKSSLPPRSERDRSALGRIKLAPLASTQVPTEVGTSPTEAAREGPLMWKAPGAQLSVLGCGLINLTHEDLHSTSR